MQQEYYVKLANDLKDNSVNSESWYKTSANFLNPNTDTQSIPSLETDWQKQTLNYLKFLITTLLNRQLSMIAMQNYQTLQHQVLLA